MRLIIFLLKCIVGILATIGLAVTALILLGIFAWQDLQSWRAPERLPERMIVTIDASDAFSESVRRGPLALLSRDRRLDIAEFWDAVEAAAADPAVAGLEMRLGRGNLSLARAQELRQAVTLFRGGGKWTVGFAESFGEAGSGTPHYYLASGLDEIWLQPSGTVDLVGFRTEMPFLAEVLDDWGVEMRFDQREAFKGAIDPLIRQAMAPEVRENMQQLLDSWLGQVQQAIAEGRGVDSRTARALIDQGPYLGGEAALEARLVDRLGYRDEFAASVEERASEAERVSLSRYARQRQPETQPDDAPEIALVRGSGLVVLGESEGRGQLGGGLLGSDTLGKTLSDAIEDEAVVAIILRLDTPGGSYVAGDAIWRQVQRAREVGKPLVISMGGVVASAGYFISAPAAHIVAQGGAITGSIGVAGGKPVLSRLWEGLGVNWEAVQAGANAGMWSPNEDFDEAQWMRFQEMLDRTYADFTDKVANGRGLTPEEIVALAGGRIWSGEDALTRGLVDELGNFRTALDAARRLAGLEPTAAYRLVDYPRRSDDLHEILEKVVEEAVGLPFGGSPGIQHLLRLGEQIAPLMTDLERLNADPRARLLEAPVLRTE